jgi:hypothetical protein
VYSISKRATTVIDALLAPLPRERDAAMHIVPRSIAREKLAPQHQAARATAHTPRRHHDFAQNTPRERVGAARRTSGAAEQVELR